MHTRILRIAWRHVPKAGAVCGSSARTELCGGWQVAVIPTATAAQGARLITIIWKHSFQQSQQRRPRQLHLIGSLNSPSSNGRPGSLNCRSVCTYTSADGNTSSPPLAPPAGFRRLFPGSTCAGTPGLRSRPRSASHGCACRPDPAPAAAARSCPAPRLHSRDKPPDHKTPWKSGSPAITHTSTRRRRSRISCGCAAHIERLRGRREWRCG